MPSDIHRTIVVTGGSREIGRAICKTFAGPGVRVCFNFNSPGASGRATAEEISAAGGIPKGMRVNADYIAGQVIHVNGGMYF